MDIDQLNTKIRINDKKYQGMLDEYYALKEQYEAQFENVQQSEPLEDRVSAAANRMEMYSMEEAFKTGQQQVIHVLDDLKQFHLEDMKRLLGQADLLMKYFNEEKADQEFLKNYEAIRGSLLFNFQALRQVYEAASGTAEEALNDIEKGLQ